MPRRGGRAAPVVDTGMVNPIMNVELGHMGQRRPSSSSVSSDGGRGALLTPGGAARALPAHGAPAQVSVAVEAPLPAPVGDDALTAPDLGELGDDDVDIDAEWREPNMHDVQAFMDHYHPRLYRNGMPYPVPICAPTGRHCCWCCTCINPFCEGRHSKLAFMGVGVGGYFKWVKLIGWTAFFMALVTFPMLLINYGNGVRLSAQETELGLSRTMLGNLGTAVNNTNVFPVQDYIPYIGEYIPVDMTLDRAQVAELYTACDIAACLVFLVASCLLLSGEEGDIAHFARRIVTVDQYSVRIKSVPAGTTRKQIELLMHDVTGERVADVSIAADSNSSTALLVQRGKLLGKRDRHRQFIRLLRSKKRAVDASSSERGRIDKRIDKRFREMLKINSKLRRLHEKWQNRDEGESRSVNAFVTFDTALGRQICLEEYPQGFCFWLCQRRSKRLHGKRLTVTPAPLPSAIIWENLATRRCSRWSRRLVTLLISVALLAVSASLMYVMRSQQVDVQADSFVTIGEQCNNTLVLTATTPPVCNCTQESYTYMAANSECHGVLAAAVLSLALAGAVALVVVGVNALFGALVEWMATYERHLVTDKMAAAAFRGLLLRQFFNTAILVILINSDVGAVFRLFGLDDPTQDLALGTNTLWEVGIAWYGTVGTPILLSAAISTVSFLFTPCIRCSARLCKRDCRCCCCCRKVMTQHELNKLFLGHQFRLHRRYARYMNQFAVGFMFSAGIPLMMWLVAAMMLIGYWFDKWWLLRKSRKPPQFNATLARLARDLMPYVLAMHLGMACVMLGNEDILVTDNLDTSAISDSRYATYTQRFVDFMQRFTRIHTLPLFVFLVLVLLYLLLSQFCGVLGTIIRLATCGHCTSRGYDVDAGPGASKDMTYTDAESGGYVHGQHTYHFVDNPWYQQRLHFTPDELESFRRAGVTMAFTLDQWVRDDTAMSSARATIVPRRSQHPVGGRAGAGAGSGGGSGRRAASPRDQRVAQAMTLQRSVATAGAVVHTPSAAPSGRGGTSGAEGAPLAKHPERGGVEEW